MNAASAQPPARLAWPWRGLGAALLLALGAHIAAFMLANHRFAFSFQSPHNTTALSTRMLESIPVSLQPPAPTIPPSPAAKRPDAPRTAPASATPTPMRKDSTAPTPVEEPKIEPKEPIAGIESAPIATETIAITPMPLDSNLTQTMAPASGAPAPPGLKLSYPGSARLEFEGTTMSKGSAISGSGILNWGIDGKSYVLSLEATALLILSRTETSIGLMSPQGLAPETYSSKRTGRSEQATHFRPEIGKIQFSNNKPDEILLVGAQDRLSAFVQLAGIIGGDPERYKIVNRIQMQVAGLDSAEVWEFNLQGISDINLPAANMQALKLSRSPRNEFDQRLELWLSPQLGYLPIRIRQSSATTPETDFTDLVLRRLP